MMLEILQAQLVLALCWAVYAVFLRRTGLLLLNRYYLLLMPLLCSVLPFISWPQSSYTTYSITLPQVALQNTTAAGADSITVYLLPVLVGLYLLGVAGVLAYTLYNYWQLRRLLKTAVPTGAGHVYTLPGTQVSFTHFNYIYLGAQLPETDRELILNHEWQHRSQKHWVDQLLMLSLCAVWWFNPFVWLLRKAMSENHEYLADAGVQAGDRAGQYYAILFEQAIGAKVYPLSQHFGDHSLTLKRIKMMERTITRKSRWISAALMLPLVGALLWMSSCENSNPPVTEGESKTAAEITKEPDTFPEYTGGQSAMVDKLVAELSYPETAKADSLEGTVFVQFVVNTAGQVEQVKVAKGVRDDLDTEALRVVTQLNSWQPGTKNGEPVNVQYTLPIKFQL